EQEVAPTETIDADPGPSIPNSPKSDQTQLQVPLPTIAQLDIGNAVGKIVSKEERLSFLFNAWNPPTDFKFPVIVQGKYNRRFLSWLSQYQWLAYSESNSGGFCKYCVLFASEGGGVGFQPLKSFVKSAWKNFKDASDLRDHSQLSYHQLLKQQNFFE
ncbi:unnamed protein product, partial [Allacma fusca]